jgi:mono/diheme cytochrome c family protein
VPGSFPALRDQIARFARVPSGRTYMVTVVTHGLAGALTANGVTYEGFMPAQALADDEAAAVLTYVANTIAGARPPVAPFTPTEVAAIRAHNAAATAQSSRTLRPDALAGK